jgi:hypothetical protein
VEGDVHTNNAHRADGSALPDHTSARCAAVAQNCLISRLADLYRWSGGQRLLAAGNLWT